MLRPKNAAAYLGLAESTFWRWVQLGRLPRGIRLSARATVWRRSDLENFIEQQSEALEGSPSRGGGKTRRACA
ncbi:MAG: helix-turn-helix domain-containing protein [Desulfovibrio sp.]|nr:helix-turn-helix domain-containing protein [Desulfovibrio sp.]